MQTDELTVLLSRLEDLCARNARLDSRCREAERRATERIYTSMELERAKKNLRAAEDKVTEWFDYATTLRALIGPKKRNDIPPQPAPLDTDIPF